ncbi:MAG: hypothetical protein K2O10_06730, partial [Muribaculaceae bacterium]|nr:hypothetical protein [Muribaculaceae bacterium]
RHVREYTVEATTATPESSDGNELTNSQKRRQQRINAQATPAGGNDSAVADRPYESPRFWAGFILLDALK